MTPPPVRFDAQGLIPAVVQDAETGEVVMLAYMDAEALRLTRETGRTHFWSRSRRTLWRKGETSGNEQIVHEVRVNCYEDSLLVRVTQVGPGCHTDHDTCYYRRLADDDRMPALALRRPDLELWYGAYAFLRDHDLADVSTTSRLLRSARPRVGERLADELVELAEVLRGTHRHLDRESDVILEASQCLYWLALLAVRQKLAADDWLRPLTRARPPVDVERTIETLVLGAEYWGEDAAQSPPEEPAAPLAASAVSVADAVRVAGADLEAVLQRDLGDLRAKPYLAPYFAASEP